MTTLAAAPYDTANREPKPAKPVQLFLHGDIVTLDQCVTEIDDIGIPNAGRRQLITRTAGIEADIHTIGRKLDRLSDFIGNFSEIGEF